MKHGGNFTEAAKAYGLDASEIIDLSTGISPRSYPIDGIDFSARHWRDLPQAGSEKALISAMRQAWSVDSNAEIVLTPGSGIIISLAAMIKNKPSQYPCKVLIPQPVYSEHEAAWSSIGHEGMAHEIAYYNAGSIPDISDDQNIVVAVQPGNPMGHAADPQAWLGLIDQLAEKDGLLVMDEAFIDLMPSLSLAPYAGRKGLMIIRSFGKFYGLAGLRLGAAIGDPDDMAKLQQFLGPWAVSTPALDIGLKAITDTDWADGQRLWAKKEMAALLDVLTSAGLKHIGGTDLYALIETQEAHDLHIYLAKQGIWTRVFDHAPQWMRFGLPMDGGERGQLQKHLTDWQNKS